LYHVTLNLIPSERQDLNLNGPYLVVRPFCSNEHYWQVYFDTFRTMWEVSTEKRYAAPARHLVVQGGQMAFEEEEKPEAAAI